MTTSKVTIVTTAHWGGDTRLNRHVDYLDRDGIEVDLVSFSDRFRPAAVLLALWAIARADGEVVILPDPEMFLIGSIVARATGKRPVIDIHEDYPRTAMTRSWVPRMMRQLVKAAAAIAVSSGRLASWRVVAAAQELARAGDAVVLNIPDPDILVPAPLRHMTQLVYVGDVTPARGLETMLEVLSHLDNSFTLLVIGRAGTDAATTLRSAAQRLGVTERVKVTGRLEHAEAWSLAGGSLAGLNLLSAAPAYLNAIATKVWEYMAIGLPPVVTDLPGQARLVANIDGALVCQSPKEVAAVVRRLGEDRVFWQRVSDRGRALVEEAWGEHRPDIVIQSTIRP